MSSLSSSDAAPAAAPSDASLVDAFPLPPALTPAAYTSLCVDRLGVSLAAGLSLRDDLPYPSTRGVLAAEALPAGAVLASVPVGALLTAASAVAAPHARAFFAALPPPALSEDDTLALALLVERALGGAGKWGALAGGAPRDFDLPFCWADDEVAALDGTGLGVLAERMRAQRDDDWAGLAPRAAVAAAAAGLDARAFSRAGYTWALCCVWSRGVSLPLGRGAAGGADAGTDGLVKALAPFFEMFNTRPGARVRHGYDARARALVVTADAPVAAGAQVCLDYGPRPTRDLIRLHGFALAGNGAESYQLEMAFRADAPDFARRLALLRIAPPRAASDGAPAGERGLIAVADGALFAHFHLAEATWSDACMRFLRVMIAPPETLDELGAVLRADKNGGCSVELELQVLRLLASSLVEILEGLRAKEGEADRVRAFEGDAARDPATAPAAAPVAAAAAAPAAAPAAEGDAAAAASDAAAAPPAAPAPPATPSAAAHDAHERRLQLAAVARFAERRILESHLAMVEDAIAELRGVVESFQAPVKPEMD
jgi:hypothetical protein